MIRQRFAQMTFSFENENLQCDASESVVRQLVICSVGMNWFTFLLAGNFLVSLRLSWGFNFSDWHSFDKNGDGAAGGSCIVPPLIFTSAKETFVCCRPFVGFFSLYSYVMLPSFSILFSRFWMTGNLKLV